MPCFSFPPSLARWYAWTASRVVWSTVAGIILMAGWGGGSLHRFICSLAVGDAVPEPITAVRTKGWAEKNNEPNPSGEISSSGRNLLSKRRKYRVLIPNGLSFVTDNAWVWVKLEMIDESYVVSGIGWILTRGCSWRPWTCVNSSGGILDADETTSQGYSYITGVAVDCPESPVLMPHGAPGGLCLSRLCMGSGLEGR